MALVTDIGIGPGTGLVDGQLVINPGSVNGSPGAIVPQTITQGMGAPTLPVAVGANNTAGAAAPVANPKGVIWWSLAMFLAGYAILHFIHYAP